MKTSLCLIIILVLIHLSIQSAGDRSSFFQICLQKCNTSDCSEGGIRYENEHRQSLMLQVLRWTCNDDCKYDCMWQTLAVFNRRGWRTPQFYGKWPFYRILGLQEPASVIFSLLNLYLHIKMLGRFRSHIKPDYPLYGLWHLYTIICANAWIWSAVFHARDTPSTEILDYASAFSIILVACYSMVYRILHTAPRFVLIIISTVFIALFYNHVMYLTLNKINYTYNMQLNIAIGSVTVAGWFLWSIWNRSRQPYTIYCAAYVSLAALFTLLEFIDHPPFFYVLDYHALWHLSTAPLIWLFYIFLIEDCKYLNHIQKFKTFKVVENKEA